MLIKPNDELKKIFFEINNDELKIISDLKFLVQRVKEWYECNGEEINIPTKDPVLKSRDSNIKFFENFYPSPDQEEAINNIYNSSFSYIWGAPGTGKTQFVLAYSIINYVKNNRRVAIFAPTNNSIEQVLYGVLKMTDIAGIDHKQIIRLGSPSKKFAQKYPDVCEAKGIIKKISELDNQINIFKKILESEKSKSLLNDIQNSFDVFEQIEIIIQEKQNLLEQIYHQERELKNLENHFDSIQEEINNIKHQIKKLKSPLNYIIQGLKNISSTNKFEKEYKIENLRKLLHQKVKVNKDLLDSITNKNVELDSLRKFHNSNEKINNLFDRIIKVSLSFEDTKKIIKGINPGNYMEKKSELMGFIKNKQSELRVGDSLALDYSKYSKEKLSERLDIFIKQKQYLLAQTTDERLKRVNIIAGTLDGYIHRYKEKNLDVDHIFLDEASYANVIKALTLFNQNSPITFLGDHKQLPPVCELGDRELKENIYSDVFVWSQSSIFIESIFHKSKEKAYIEYIENQNFDCKGMSKSDLKRTHRFGYNLAGVLDKYIYNNGFTSVNEKGITQIICYNIPYIIPQPNNERKKPNRVNQAEAEAIQSFIRSNDLVEFAILAPYTAQVRAIGNLLPEQRNAHKILTVHGSQGQEWDDVILSVVDTTRMYFTDSLNTMSKGLNLINTAVSRAKKRLIIFCNYNFWITQDLQLIKGLIEAGIKYEKN